MTTDAPPGRPAEPAIEDYGLIGDTGTAALVASDGGPDWMCVARFDGPKVFGRLVGGPDAGCFAISRPSGATLAAPRLQALAP